MGLKPLDSVASAEGAAFRLDWTKYRREPCEAVRSREVRLTKDAEGKPQWIATETMDDEMRSLLRAVETGLFATQRAVAEHLTWDPAKVTRMKRAAIKAGLTTDREWDACLAEVGKAAMEGVAEF